MTHNLFEKIMFKLHELDNTDNQTTPHDESDSTDVVDASHNQTNNSANISYRITCMHELYKLYLSIKDLDIDNAKSIISDFLKSSSVIELIELSNIKTHIERYYKTMYRSNKRNCLRPMAIVVLSILNNELSEIHLLHNKQQSKKDKDDYYIIFNVKEHRFINSNELEQLININNNRDNKQLRNISILGFSKVYQITADSKLNSSTFKLKDMLTFFNDNFNTESSNKSVKNHLRISNKVIDIIDNDSSINITSKEDHPFLFTKKFIEDHKITEFLRRTNKQTNLSIRSVRHANDIDYMNTTHINQEIEDVEDVNKKVTGYIISNINSLIREQQLEELPLLYSNTVDTLEDILSNYNDDDSLRDITAFLLEDHKKAYYELLNKNEINMANNVRKILSSYFTNTSFGYTLDDDHNNILTKIQLADESCKMLIEEACKCIPTKWLNVLSNSGISIEYQQGERSKKWNYTYKNKKLTITIGQLLLSEVLKVLIKAIIEVQSSVKQNNSHNQVILKQLEADYFKKRTELSEEDDYYEDIPKYSYDASCDDYERADNSTDDFKNSTTTITVKVNNFKYKNGFKDTALGVIDKRVNNGDGKYQLLSESLKNLFTDPVRVTNDPDLVKWLLQNVIQSTPDIDDDLLKSTVTVEDNVHQDVLLKLGNIIKGIRMSQVTNIGNKTIEISTEPSNDKYQLILMMRDSVVNIRKVTASQAYYITFLSDGIVASKTNNPEKAKLLQKSVIRRIKCPLAELLYGEDSENLSDDKEIRQILYSWLDHSYYMSISRKLKAALGNKNIDVRQGSFYINKSLTIDNRNNIDNYSDGAFPNLMYTVFYTNKSDNIYRVVILNYSVYEDFYLKCTVFNLTEDDFGKLNNYIGNSVFVDTASFNRLIKNMAEDTDKTQRYKFISTTVINRFFNNGFTA